jgi:CheY-like chemotaxis protein
VSRVLVVDDEPQIRRALAITLRARGYQVDLAANGEDALHQAADHNPDVIILDLGLPGIDGIQVIRGLRGWTQAPIIVLTVREREADKVTALDAGAGAGPSRSCSATSPTPSCSRSSHPTSPTWSGSAISRDSSPGWWRCWPSAPPHTR